MSRWATNFNALRPTYQPLTDLARKCDQSPIEWMLADALDFVFTARFAPKTVEVIPQYKLGRFRYDFAIKLLSLKRPIFLIECDGAEFHNTPAQILNDRAKDTLAHKMQSPCLRYRGSVIYANAYGIATEIANAVEHMRRWGVRL